MSDINRAYTLQLNSENKNFVSHPYKPSTTTCPGGGIGCGAGPNPKKSCAIVYDLSTARPFDINDGAGNLRKLNH